MVVVIMKCIESFVRDLCMQACLSRLVSQHLPKKEASYRRGWRFWRRGETVQTDTSSATVSAATKV